jgi:hypothetical protein
MPTSKHKSLPPYPSSIDKARSLVTVPDGYRYRFTITDEIVRPQTGMPEKLLCLQRIKFEDGKEEVRLGYYIIGKKPKMLGKWVWGQYCTFMPLKDFKALVRAAEKKGWI